MLPELLGDSLLLTLLGNGLLLDVGLRACRIACALHYVYSKTGWVVGYGYWAYCKGVGMRSRHLQFSLLVLVCVLVGLLVRCTTYILKLAG